MTLAEKQQEFIDMFNDLATWPDRFDYMILLSDELPVMPQHLIVPENKLQNCISNTYFCCTYLKGVAHIYGKSNACIPAGIVSIFIELFQGRTREEINTTVLNFHTETELLSHLSPNRADAVLQMISRLNS